MVNLEDRVGISAMSLYVPGLRVQLEAWCEWTNNPWDKIQNVVGRSFRVCAPDENVYTMAAGAVLDLIRHNDIDPTRIGFLGLGTESSTDNAAGAVIVRGMVDRALEGISCSRGGSTRCSKPWACQDWLATWRCRNSSMRAWVASTA